jgi:hypothetical protein
MKAEMGARKLENQPTHRNSLIDLSSDFLERHSSLSHHDVFEDFLILLNN